MAEKKQLFANIELLEGCTVTKDKKVLTVKGPKGELKKRISDSNLILEQEANNIKLSYEKNNKENKKNLFSTKAHLKNMIEGVTKGFKYTLKICSGHFPMTVSMKNTTFEIKNFIGEVVPRRLEIKEGATVKVSGDIITVEGVDKEIAGQVAASIEKLTRRPGFDKRIFQDGIYITDKNGKNV